MSTYYEGKGVESSSAITVAGSKTWESLVKEKVLSGMALKVTKSLYFALPKEERDKMKHSRPYVMPAVYRPEGAEGSSHRRTDSIVGIALLGVDFDSDEKSEPAQLELLKQYVGDDGGLMMSKLGKYNFAAFKTINSRPEYPRIRVLVDAEVKVEEYSRAVKNIADMLGLAYDKASENPNQPMSLPVRFLEEGMEEHPVFASRLDGVPFKSADITAEGVKIPEIPMPKMEGIYAETAVKALVFLEPDMAYLDWLKVGMGLKHQFGDAGFALWDAWSKLGKKYPGTDKLREKWKSISSTLAGSREPVTFGTVAKMAADKGWSFNEVTCQAESEFRKWLKDGTRTEQELRYEAAGRAYLLPGKEYDLYSRWIASAINTRFEDVKITPKDILKMINAKVEAEAAKSREGEKVPAWTRSFIYVKGTKENPLGIFYRSVSNDRYTTMVLNQSMAKYLCPKPESNAPEDTPIPLVQPDQYLLNNIQILQAEDFMYAPDKPDETIVKIGMSRYVNTYVKDYFPQEDAAEADAKRLWGYHMDLLCSTDSDKETMTDFFAYMVQFPGKKINWAPVLLGVQGTGKSFCVSVAGAVLGKSNVESVAGDTIVSSPFNSYAEGNQFVAIEEIRVTGTSRHAIMDRLKGVVAQDDASINAKNKNTKSIRNVTNYLLCTNYPDALAVDKDDRRYRIIESPLFSKEQVLLHTKHYTEIFNFLENHPGGFRSLFLHHKISDAFNPKGMAAETEAFFDMTYASRSELEDLIEDLLSSGSNPLITPRICVISEISEEAKLRSIPFSESKRITAILKRKGYGETKDGSEKRYMVGGKGYQVWGKRDKDGKVIKPSHDEIRETILKMKGKQ